MSGNRYLEFSSAWRDRNQYPNPASFVAEISQSGQSQIRTLARDPVCNASPVLYWNSSFTENNTPAGATGIAITQIGVVAGKPTLGNLTDPSVITISAATGALRSDLNFYVGAVLDIVSPATGFARISSYQLINPVTAQVTVSTAIPVADLNVAVTASITNPTGDTINDFVPKVFVPFSPPIDNFYINYMLENINTGEIKPITAFDGNTHLATLGSNTATAWDVPNQNFAIRKSAPGATGTIYAINSAASVGTITTAQLGTATSIQLQLATSSPNSGQYAGGFLRMIQPLPETGSTFAPVAPYGEEEKIAKYLAGDGIFTAISSGSNTFSLNPISASPDDNFYVGGLITDVTTGETRQVTSYVGATGNPAFSGTVAVNWAAGAVGDDWTMRTAILAQTFSTVPVVSVTGNYEIETFTRDNWNPFNYGGSLVSSQEMTCYEVELLNLVLPNILLASGRGGRAVFYPYMYVELQQVSAASGGMRGIIYSNNPNAYRMLFRVIMDDTTQSLISPFIKVDSDGMAHPLKFKPNDSFKFAVYLENGELFQTVQSDFYSPTEPNPLVQISACFSFKKT